MKTSGKGALFNGGKGKMVKGEERDGGWISSRKSSDFIVIVFGNKN